MISRKYICPICKTYLHEYVYGKEIFDGSALITFELKCDTCCIYSESVCDCKDSCTCDYHLDKAYNSIKESALFLKEFILKGGFDNGKL